ncbi:zinc finger protein ZFP2 [Anopheles cruzii]|uniref:zinc finger protein ZFP2 n=1 Tax=Anopheles cruzii TaxID=68878 RepID=UPI0022EC5243|nr:zinc finger protein ZFP2 [Anopheles cruzii]
MCTKSLSCILCGQPNFPNVDALRVSLLKVTARPLKCPICGDELLGLDKLTIHLFGHSLLEDQAHDSKGGGVTKDDPKPSGPTTTGSCKSIRKVRKKGAPTEVNCEADIPPMMGKMSPRSAEPSSGSSKPYCSECDVEFRSDTLLKMHQEVFHETPTKGAESGAATGTNFYCHICPKKFKMRGSLKIHMRVVHQESPKKMCLDQTHATNATSTSSSFTITGSDLTFGRDDIIAGKSATPLAQRPQNLTFFQQPPTGVSETKTHIIQIIDPRQLAQVVYLPPNKETPGGVDQSTSGGQPSALDAAVPQPRFESISLPSSPQQLSHDHPKQWECDVCRKSFTTKYFLKKHNRLHTGEMPYTCAICNKSFTFQQSYHKHLLYHSDEKPHACAVCGRAFKELSTLHNHERIHSGEKPFACETCGKCFRQRVSYLVHRRIHTGLMPYKCSGCDKSFRYKVSQRTHKCPATPPGTVVRKTGDLLQKLLQSSSIFPATQQRPEAPPIFTETTTYRTTPESMADDDARQTAEYVNRALDELVDGTYDKLDISDGASTTLYNQQQPLYADSDQIQLPRQDQRPHPATSEASFPRIESLCLLSPSAFDSSQLDDLESLKLDNGW